MTLIITVDECFGIVFGGRRQSRDRELTRDAVRLACGRRIIAKEYSRLLFKEAGEDTNDVIFEDEPTRVAERDDVVLLELCVTEDDLSRADELVVYNWNRRYPATSKLDTALINRYFIPVRTVEFKGNSHEKLTRVEYIRK